MNASRQEYFAKRAVQMAAMRPTRTYKEIGLRFDISGERVRQSLIAHGHLAFLRNCVLCGIGIQHGRGLTNTCSAQCWRQRHHMTKLRMSQRYRRKYPEVGRNKRRRRQQKINTAIRALRKAGLLEGVPAKSWKQRGQIYSSARELGLI